MQGETQFLYQQLLNHQNILTKKQKNESRRKN